MVNQHERYNESEAHFQKLITPTLTITSITTALENPGLK